MRFAEFCSTPKVVGRRDDDDCDCDCDLRLATDKGAGPALKEGRSQLSGPLSLASLVAPSCCCGVFAGQRSKTEALSCAANECGRSKGKDSKLEVPQLTLQMLNWRAGTAGNGRESVKLKRSCSRASVGGLGTSKRLGL